MADSKLADLTAVTALAGDELLYVVDDPGGTPLDRKVTVSNLARAKVVAESHADAGPSNTTTETALASLTLPGGIVAVGDLLRVVAAGDSLNNTGANVGHTMRFKLGGTTMATSNNVNVATNADRRKWFLIADLIIEAVGGSPAERAAGFHIWSGAGSTGWVLGTGFLGGVFSGVATEDLSTDKSVAVTVALGTASASADMIAKFASLTLLRKAA